MSVFRNSLFRLNRRLALPLHRFSSPRIGVTIRPSVSWNQPSSSLATQASSAESELVITDHVVNRLKSIASSGEYLRVQVDSGGCSGFEYKFELVQAPEADDRVFEKDGVHLVVDEVSLDFIRGATIDYQTELIKSAFRVVQNPRAEKGCSCGASFALKTPGSGKK